MIAGLVFAALLVAAVWDQWSRRKLASEGRTRALAACTAKDKTSAECGALVSTHHRGCWELAWRPSTVSKYGRGAPAHLDQPTYDDCIFRGPDAVRADRANAREAEQRRASERNTLLQ